MIGIMGILFFVILIPMLLGFNGIKFAVRTWGIIVISLIIGGILSLIAHSNIPETQVYPGNVVQWASGKGPAGSVVTDRCPGGMDESQGYKGITLCYDGITKN